MQMILISHNLLLKLFLTEKDLYLHITSNLVKLDKSPKEAKSLMIENYLEEKVPRLYKLTFIKIE